MSGGAEYFGGKIWQKPDIFDLWAVSEKMLVSWRNNFGQVVNTAFHMFCRKIFRTKWFFFLKNKWAWHFFWFWMTKFQICGRTFRQGCQKQSLRDQRKVWWNVLWKMGQLYIFWWFFWGNSDLQETPVSSVRHSTRPVEHSKGQVSGRNETFPTLGHWARIFWVSGRRILADLPKLLSMWPEQLLE